MRTFKKGDRLEKTNDVFIIDALLQSGYEEVIEADEEIVKPAKKRSKIEE